jgi:hypothetical protein
VKTALRLAAAAALWLNAIAAPSAAQTPETQSAPAPPAQLSDPDRPDVTNGTHIVDVGLLQLEVGGLFTRTGSGQQGFGTPLTARLGLFDWLEARIGTDGLLVQADGTVVANGYGNTQLGAKLRLWADPGGVPVLSILPVVNIPTANADKGLGSGKPDYTVSLLTGTDIGRHAHVDVNYGIGAIGDADSGSHFTQHLVSVSVSDAISENWNPYVEAFWFSRPTIDQKSSGVIDAGAIYQVGLRYAIDGGLAFGVTPDAPQFAAFGGVSILVGDVLGSHGAVERQRNAERRARAQAPKK